MDYGRLGQRSIDSTHTHARTHARTHTHTHTQKNDVRRAALQTSVYDHKASWYFQLNPSLFTTNPTTILPWFSRKILQFPLWAVQQTVSLLLSERQRERARENNCQIVLPFFLINFVHLLFLSQYIKKYHPDRHRERERECVCAYVIKHKRYLHNMLLINKWNKKTTHWTHFDTLRQIHI